MSDQAEISRIHPLGYRMCGVDGCPNRAPNYIQDHVDLYDPDWMRTPGYWRCDEHRHVKAQRTPEWG